MVFIRDESFIAENEITTNKNNEKIGPSGDILKWLEEPSYFLNYQNGKINYFNFIQITQTLLKPKSRYNEVIKFVEAGLQDLSISRTSFSWGIDVPGSSNHIIYVWLDALFNYLSVLNDENKMKSFGLLMPILLEKIS